MSIMQIASAADLYLQLFWLLGSGSDLTLVIKQGIKKSYVLGWTFMQ
jgi:hypothetical protein